MTRRELREHCFKMLFCTDFYPEGEKDGQLDQYFETPVEDETAIDGTDLILHRVDLKVEDRKYLKERVKNVISLIPDLDRRINEVAQGWKTKRMGKVELAILRLALYEMKEDDSIPEKVAINEAVELAKKFGGDDSSAFINGILAKLVAGDD